MFKCTILTAALLSAVATVSSANSVPCAPRDLLIEKLQSKYSEALTSGGMQGQDTVQAVIEVWSSEATGTFTVMITNPQGLSCILAAGNGYFTQDFVSKEPEGVDG